MSDSSEADLRKALDAIDRGRRWAIVGVGALFLITAISVGRLFAVAVTGARGASPDAGLLKVLWLAVTTQMLFTACCAVVVMWHVSRSTKATVRAMNLFGR
jgi:cation transporter-like permease